MQIEVFLLFFVVPPPLDPCVRAIRRDIKDSMKDNDCELPHLSVLHHIGNLGERPRRPGGAERRFPEKFYDNQMI